MTTSIPIDCPSCHGSGVYRGFAEPPGVGVVCLKCGGSGAAQLTYEPFAGRVRREGIQTVKRSAGTFIGTGVGPTGDGVAYEEFLAGKMP